MTRWSRSRRCLLRRVLTRVAHPCPLGADDEERTGLMHRVQALKVQVDTPGTIDGLKDALGRLRKFGGRCMLGCQSTPQDSSTYGDGEAKTTAATPCLSLARRAAQDEREVVHISESQT